MVFIGSFGGTDSINRVLMNIVIMILVAVPSGCVTFKRRVLDGPTTSQWSQSTNQLTDCLFTSQGLIEDAEGAAQVCELSPLNVCIYQVDQ